MCALMTRFFTIVFAGLGALLSPVAVAGDCPSSNTPQQIGERLKTAQHAFGELDIDSFSFAMEEVSLMLPCLGAVPEPGLAAQVHRMVGVKLYADGRVGPARSSLLAGKALQPDYVFPDDLFPEGYALLDEWQELSATQTAVKRAPVPRGATVYFDGAQTRDRPIDRATLFQRMDAEGVMRNSVYLQPTDVLPSYAAIPRQRNRILMATAAAGVGAAVSYGLAMTARNAFFEEGGKRGRKDLNDLRTQANRGFVSAGVFSTLAISGGIVAVVIGPR
jgi:hypothetical protein